MVADEGIETAELTQQRNSALEMPVVASFATRMALYSDAPYEEVFQQLIDRCSGSPGFTATWAPPRKSAIFQAWLGFAPLNGT